MLLSCDCTVCDGLTIDAPADLLDGLTARQHRTAIHNYVQAAHSPAGGIGWMLAQRRGLIAV